MVLLSDHSKITVQQIMEMDLPNIILYATPVMILLVLAEWGISHWKNRDTYNTKDTFSAAAIGVGNLVVTALTKTLTFGIILFFYNLVPWRIPPGPVTFVLCLFWLDFWRYWAHRLSHEKRFLWATHVTHHNSEKYNWSVSFRLGWTQGVKTFFFVPVALVGFDPITFFICHQIAVLYQFWIHTEYITKLPRPIEFFFTTPSHHRVHHASNAKYIDRNYGSTFIIWDRIFGTFQPELSEEKPHYGITKPVNSYNPVYLNFHEWMDIARDVKNAKTWKDKWKFFYASPTKLAEEQAEMEARAKENEKVFSE